MYGQKLQRAIRTFLEDFVHHMEQVRIAFTVKKSILNSLITQTHIFFLILITGGSNLSATFSR